MRDKNVFTAAAVAALASAVACTTTVAQQGAQVFGTRCAECHTPAGDERSPGVTLLRQLSPRAIVTALEDGVMRAEGAELTPEQRIRVAEYLSGRSYSEQRLPDAAFCQGGSWSGLAVDAISSMGFGGNLAGTGYQPPELAGLDASEVPDLELRWAFAFPDAGQMRAKPTIVGDAVVVGGPLGEVVALDAATGCVRWGIEADAPVRGAVIVGEGPGGRATAWFVDARTNAYAVDVTDGSVIWKYRVGWHATSYGTGSPALYDGRLFVPISSLEVVTSGDPRYECCTASGAVASLDAMTGDVLWYHRVIPDYAEETGRNGAGVTTWAPSGAPVWSSPTVDPDRGLVYAGTGENYTRPTTEHSDAIIALDIETGELAWSFQAVYGDAFNMACTTARYRENCPDPPGPDLDFGMAPMLVTRENGDEILVAGQKSGTVWALDPDEEAVLWDTQIGKGGALGGIHWGMATDGRYAYAPIADRGSVIVDINPDQEPSPGLYALDLRDGKVAWSAPFPEDACEGKERCYEANSAAVTVIDGVVFAGGLDGVIRAHSTEDGAVLWEYDTTEVTESTNGVPARGGAIDGPGPVVALGMLFVNSGYGTFNQMPGNLLLAFAPRGAGDPAR